MTYFKELYNQLPAKSFNALSRHRNHRVQDSINNNPYFFNGPFTGVAIAGGANSFVWRLAANHSKEYPQGYLSKETFASFWSVFGKGEDLHWRPGWDRIPNNWYRRPLDDEYSLAFAGEDLARYAIQHPETAKVGGNLGKTNTFTGVDVTDLSGGVYNAKDLLNGNNAACFFFRTGQLGAPDVLSKIFKDITGPLAKLNKAFDDALAPLQCRNLEKFDESALRKYPGFRKPKAHA